MTPDIVKLRDSLPTLEPIIDRLELQLVDDPTWDEPSDTSYLSDADRQNPDIAANVEAMAETNRLIAWFGRDAEGYLGLWRGPKNRSLADAPVVRLDSEGQYSIVAATVPEYLAIAMPEDEFATTRDALTAAGFKVGFNPDAIWGALDGFDDDPNAYRNELYERARVARGLPRTDEEDDDGDGDGDDIRGDVTSVGGAPMDASDEDDTAAAAGAGGDEGDELDEAGESVDSDEDDEDFGDAVPQPRDFAMGSRPAMPLVATQPGNVDVDFEDDEDDVDSEDEGADDDSDAGAADDETPPVAAKTAAKAKPPAKAKTSAKPAAKKAAAAPAKKAAKAPAKKAPKAPAAKKAAKPVAKKAAGKAPAKKAGKAPAKKAAGKAPAKKAAKPAAKKAAGKPAKKR